MFIFSDKMKVMPSIKKISRIGLSLAVVFLSVSSTIFGQTSTWNGSSWDNGAPSSSTGSYTFYVIGGTNCSIGNANMTALYVQGAGVLCTITGTVTSNSVVIQYNSNYPTLAVNGVLNVTNLTVGGFLNGSGTVNISAGTFSQTYDNINPGGIYPSLKNLNVLSGSISFTYVFVIQNLNISSGASVSITNYADPTYPSITGNLTINGSLYNYYAQTGAFSKPYYFTIANLIINNSGLYNSASGNSSITNSFKIGGSLTPANKASSYYYNWDVSGNSNELDIFGSANIKFTDVSYSSASYANLGTLKIYGGGKFTIDKDITVNTLTINDGGNVITSGNPALNVNTSIDPIAGRLILPGATLNYTPTTLTLNGTNAAIAYLNKPNYYVTLSGGTDTVRNCTFQKLVVNSGAKGIISNNSTSLIQRIDAADQVTIASLPKIDTVQISATGSAMLNGSMRVTHMVDITAGGSLTSNGNLTMLDGSNLYFATDGQVVGNIVWHRKYGSTGWVYMGVPFPNLTRALVGSGGISQQTIYMNEYDESKVSPRWSAVGTTEALVVGKGYNLAMGTITNDTLVFTGNPRLQSVSLPVTYSYSNGSQFDSQRGYNLVSNPFTAPLSVSGFFTDNPHLNKIYYWDNQGGGKGVYVTRTSSDIFTPQLSSVTAKNQTKISATYLAPNQGFFIKLDSANYATTPSVVFNPSSVTKNLNDNFLKDAPVLLRLNAKNTSGTLNDIVFQFNNAATSEINPDLDFSKLVSDTYPLEIYSFKKGSKFSIQTVKVDTATRIPIGLVIKNNEKHSLWVDNFDALPAGADIYIHDKLTDRSVNLRDSAFTGGLPAGTYDNRFEVVFKNVGSASSTSDLENQSASSDVVVRSLNSQVYVDFKTAQKNVDIQVCDISGRVIYEKKVNWAQGPVLLDTDFNSTKVYLIKIAGNQLFRVVKFLML